MRITELSTFEQEQQRIKIETSIVLALIQSKMVSSIKMINEYSKQATNNILNNSSKQK